LFKIPAVVPGVTGLKWSASDASYVALADDPSTGGVMITTKKPGRVNIIARSGALSGASELTITAYKAADCEAGELRYNGGIGIDGSIQTAFLGGAVPKNVGCHACHGDGAQFFSVQHTPEQTGGWSDDDLLNIVMAGFKPAGSILVTPIPVMVYQRF